MDDQAVTSKRSSAEVVKLEPLFQQLSEPAGELKRWTESLLALEMQVVRAKGATALRFTPQGSVEIVGVFPVPVNESAVPSWVVQCAAGLKKAGRPGQLDDGFETQVRMQKTAMGPALVAPLLIPGAGPIVQSFLMPENIQLRGPERQIKILCGLLRGFALQQQRVTSQDGLDRLEKAMEVLIAVNQHDRCLSAVLSLCNTLCTQWGCERVSIGFLKGRFVRMRATSHTENFSRKQQLIQDIEAAMEECLDQDMEVAYPPDPKATVIWRSAQALAQGHGANAVLSLPLRRQAEAKAVVTLERPGDMPFDDRATEALRLTVDLCTPRILGLYQRDRWFGARWLAGIRSCFALVFGSRYTWIKLMILAVMGLAIFAVYGQGTYRAQASFVFKPAAQRTICAPFDGYVKTVGVEVGDTVKRNSTIMAVLDTTELELKLASAKADEFRYRKEEDAYTRDGDIAKASISSSQADSALADINLLKYMISQAQIFCPVPGVVVSGEMKERIGAPVKTGDILFEVTDVNAIEAELYVPEDQIQEIVKGQTGFLATASYPGRRIDFKVERISPSAEVVNNRNVFKVRATLETHAMWMRPGMEGIAKVDLGQRRYLWIWSRKIINWLRMKLWF